jgi:glutamyl endopeptidase
VSNSFACPIGWQNNGTESLDYAVIMLSQPLGNTVGWFGYAMPSNEELQNTIANVAGYPIVAPDGGAAGRQWYDADFVRSFDDDFVYYNLDTLAGESGACVYRLVNNQPFAMAIHTGSNGVLDRGVRITQPAYNNLRYWASQ